MSSAALQLLENRTLLSSQMGFWEKKPQTLNPLHNLWCVSVPGSLYWHCLSPKISLQQGWTPRGAVGDSSLSGATSVLLTEPAHGPQESSSAANPCFQMHFHSQEKLLLMLLLIGISRGFSQTFQFCHSRNASEGSALGSEAL